MALWSLQRIEVLDPDSTIMTCVGIERPTKAVLKDMDTGLIEVTTLCYDWEQGDAANKFLNALVLAGYTPKDW